MRREEFGLTEDGTDVVPPKPIPWRGFRSGGYLQVSEEKLMTISAATDSSDEMDIFIPNAEGMIRLEEIPTEPPAGANLTLAIATTDDVDGGRVGSYMKGKGVMTGPDIRGGQLFGLQMGSGSGFANTEGADVALEEDEAYAGEQKDEEEIGSNNQLYVGQVFVDRDAFKVHMSLHALANKYIYFKRKSEPGKLVLECSGVNCQWRVYAAKITGCPLFEIKTLDSNHHCTVSERGQFRRHATSSIVGGMMRSKYVGIGSGPRPGALRDHSVPISYWTAWKSRKIAIENGRGNVAAAYSTLPFYLQQLAIANPGTLVALETSKGPGNVQRFKYLFLSFGASQKGFDFMRKVVIIDGTHLKGKFAGCLLTTSVQDGNYQIFPIAFGIVDSENDQSWTWFFNKLLAVVTDATDLVFVSDRHTAIYSGIRRVYPMAKHCSCLLHLQRNVQTIFKKKHLGYLLGRAARAYKLEDFYLHFNELKVVDGACADYLIRVGLEHWTRSHFDGARYNIMTSNLAESLNATLSEAREYPIVPLLEYIRSMVMGWFSSRRDAAAKNVGALTPKVTDIVMRNFKDSTGYAVKHIINNEYEVVNGNGMYHRVDLDKKTCSCKEFGALAIPCAHAVSAAIY
ncbi:PREDICTED: uncharacterized protein LOC106303121 [Brassica oleracea var. oleracea]|uniref:uncharacterized protein LOC106303121 n=1 Tax=Brassica oleracea var. oleracea TaxID=109376 RepID=UPI0006A6C931|nr:PREDICTED: uncharacterized protein LOC106303121 [Brassica oleracea var. oleracea]